MLSIWDRHKLYLWPKEENIEVEIACQIIQYIYLLPKLQMCSCSWVSSTCPSIRREGGPLITVWPQWQWLDWWWWYHVITFIIGGHHHWWENWNYSSSYISTHCYIVLYGVSSFVTSKLLYWIFYQYIIFVNKGKKIIFRFTQNTILFSGLSFSVVRKVIITVDR